MNKEKQQQVDWYTLWTLDRALSSSIFNYHLYLNQSQKLSPLINIVISKLIILSCNHSPMKRTVLFESYSNTPLSDGSWTKKDMNNEAFVSRFLTFLHIVLKSVGLAPFSYSKSKRLFEFCKISTVLSYVISGFILTISLPIEVSSAFYFKPYRENTVSYAIGYLHIFFTLAKIWFNQIITIAYRSVIIKHFNQAFQINDYLKRLCKEERLLDDQIVRKIKFRIFLFVLQSVAIIFGVNAYISRSFVQHSASLLTRAFICFSYINSIFVTTIYLGGSLVLSERYCRVLCKIARRLMKEVYGRGSSTDSQKLRKKIKLNEMFNRILKTYDVILQFIENSHNLFACHAIICAISTFLISLHGVSKRLFAPLLHKFLTL